MEAGPGVDKLAPEQQSNGKRDDGEREKEIQVPCERWQDIYGQI